MNYVVGFAFWDEWLVLIEKNKPDWQKGKLNGVGGKMDGGETAKQAMAREFEEETGVVTASSQWRLFTTMTFKEGSVFCFVTKLPNEAEPRTTTDERIYCLTVEEALSDPGLIPNLLWTIPMARFALDNPASSFVPSHLAH